MLADDPDNNGATVEINVDIMVEAKGIELEVWTGLELDLKLLSLAPLAEQSYSHLEPMVVRPEQPREPLSE